MEEATDLDTLFSSISDADLQYINNAADDKDIATPVPSTATRATRSTRSRQTRRRPRTLQRTKITTFFYHLPSTASSTQSDNENIKQHDTATPIEDNSETDNTPNHQTDIRKNNDDEID